MCMQGSSVILQYYATLFTIKMTIQHIGCGTVVWGFPWVFPWDSPINTKNIPPNKVKRRFCETENEIQRFAQFSFLKFASFT